MGPNTHCPPEPSLELPINPKQLTQSPRLSLLLEPPLFPPSHRLQSWGICFSPPDPLFIIYPGPRVLGPPHEPVWPQHTEALLHPRGRVLTSGPHFLTLQSLLQALSSGFPPHHPSPQCCSHQGLQGLHCCSTLGMSSRLTGFDHTLLDAPPPVLRPTLSRFSSSDTFTQALAPWILTYCPSSESQP